MRRWLKDKKKDKRANSSGQDDDGREDDYGFGKEKTAVKSPQSKRELPPTPAAPEEKSPHIYEEIPDLAVSDTSGQNKVLKVKTSDRTDVKGKAASTHLHRQNRGLDDDISPYMVVPVDKEVRQTPTDFHRNGTPEVHCDVIVKDTHCEILLSRKPKVNTFRREGGVSDHVRNVRNNTHFCSQDRRASVDCLNAGKLSSAFSNASAAFSPSSPSKSNPAVGLSSQSLSNFHDHQQLHSCEEKDSGGSFASGIVTYSAASNFVPRSTKLTFSPLPGKDPCVEAFGEDPGQESHCTNYSSIGNRDSGTIANCLKYPVAGESPASVTYASIQEQTDTNLTPVNQVMFEPPKSQQGNDKILKKSYVYKDEKSLSSKSFMSDSAGEKVDFTTVGRTGIIRALSPSNSSTCTYASVTFPEEPKHYSTIPELISSSFSSNFQDENDSKYTNSENVIYSTVSGTLLHNNQFLSSNSCCDSHHTKPRQYPGAASLHSDGCSGGNMTAVCSGFSDTSSNFIFNRVDRGSSRLHQATLNRGSIDDMHITYTSAEGDNIDSNNVATLRLSDVNRNFIDLEFCSCSDDRSSCGCSDAKNHQDDDAASSVGAGCDASTSCRGCGRLIRQITYSESYSDETYEHVYASRLLVRTGRRFSSPDITLSEVSHSEFQDISHGHSPDFHNSFSRDDTWASTRSMNIIPPPYSAVENTFKESGVSDWTAGNSELELEISENDDILESECKGLTPLRSLHCERENFLSANQPGRANMGGGSITTSVKGPYYHTKGTGRLFKAQQVRGPVSEKLTTGSCSQTEDIPECCEDQIRKSAQIATKQADAHSGITAKMSKTKALKVPQYESPEDVKDGNAAHVQNEVTCHVSVIGDNKGLIEIPEKNTKRLSKFFQLKSNKEITKDLNENMTLSTAQHKSNFPAPIDNPQLSDTATDVDESALDRWATGSNSVVECENPNTPLSQDNMDGACLQSRQLHAPAQLPDHLPGSAFTQTGEGTKPTNKTDSGDTCYEYDISTSSEGEQTSYECFLSKVKSTLNLKHEAQYIAESEASRRKLICKRCKRDGMYSVLDTEEDRADNCPAFCPHIEAKFGDLRAIFEDLVVDQRAAILDCLTDNTNNPYNMRSHSHESHCRECGCEILTSDSESLTTVYSLLSQQFRMTSPSGQTPSCDSDEGTMADNSCESADDDCSEDYKRKDTEEINSSGYDEPNDAISNLERKRVRKKEKGDKKSVRSAGSCNFSKNEDQPRKRLSGASRAAKVQENLNGAVKKGLLPCDSHKHGIKDTKHVSGDGLRKSTSKKTRALQKRVDPSIAKEIGGTHCSIKPLEKNECGNSRPVESCRSRASIITDRAIQDIYAPLPPKALSMLTSRNHGTSTGMPCTCGKGRQPTMTTMTLQANVTDRSLLSTETLHKTSPGKSQVPNIRTTVVDRANAPGQHYSEDGDEQKNAEFLEVRKAKDARKCIGNKLEQISSKGSHLPLIADKETVHGKMDDCDETASEMVVHAQDTRVGNSIEITYEGKLEWLSGNDKDAVGDSCLQDLDISSHKPTSQSGTLGKTHTTRETLHREISSERVHMTPASVSQDSKLKYCRKQKMELATLDLLPETVLDGDEVESNQQHQRSLTHAAWPKVVERMTKLFECQTERIQGKDYNGDDKGQKTSHTGSAVTNKSLSTANLSSEFAAVPDGKSVFQGGGPTSNQPVTPVKPNMSDKRPYIGKAAVNRAQSEHGNSTGKRISHAAKVMTTSSPAYYKSIPDPEQNEENETEMEGSNMTGNQSRTRDMLPVSTNTNVNRVKHSSSDAGDSRTRSQKSPTPSSSSISSTSSTRKKGGNTKPRKLAKKSYQRKRSKSRSERRRSSTLGHEERTYYYFSSDFSDIDVVEIDDWESYASTASLSSKISPSKKINTHKKTAEDRKAPSCGRKDKTICISSDKVDEHENDMHEQEVYSIPPSSAELRKVKESSEADASPQPSPEISKTRKVKRIDVYKTRKSNNKLLSDLIIKNYDMQIYGNI